MHNTKLVSGYDRYIIPITGWLIIKPDILLSQNNYIIE